MDSPQNQVWGPHLWMILHSAAERLNSKLLNRLPTEEQRIWSLLLTSLKFSLPCPLCKKHYTEYLSSNPIVSTDITFIRTWLYNLHNKVNITTNKPAAITLEQIPELYSKPFNFTYHFNIVYGEMVKALRLGWSSRDDIQRSVRLFQELKRFYDFF
jgi:Erv1 / Alr family